MSAARAAAPVSTRRRLIVNLVPLLDVLALMIFGIYIQSQALARRGKTHVAPELRKELEEQARKDVEPKIRSEYDERLNALNRSVDRLNQNLGQSAQRQIKLEQTIADRRSLAAAMEGVAGLGLNADQIERAVDSLPGDEAQRENFRQEMRKHRNDRPDEFPGVFVHVLVDEPGTVVVRRADRELGRISDYRSSDDLRVRLDNILERGADDVVFFAVTWDNITNVAVRSRIVTEGVRKAVDLIRNRPENIRKTYFVTVPGYRRNPAER